MSARFPMELNRSFWSGKQVCVTGGTGFLGYHIVKLLATLRARVRVLGLPPAAEHPVVQEPLAELVSGDVRDAAIVGRAIADCDVIFHTAGLVAVWGPALRYMDDVHLLGTRHVLAAARPGARIVHTSSIVAVGASRSGEILTEDSPFNLNRVGIDYVRAKRAAEQIALAAAGRGQHVVVTNPGYLAGPEDYGPSAMGRFCVRFWKGRVPFVPPGGLNLVDVRDVAHGHLLAAEHGRPGRRYILGGENCSFAEFLNELRRAGSMDPRALPRLPRWALYTLAALATCRGWWTHREPYPALQHVRLNRYFWYHSSGRAIQELGYRSRSLADCLTDTYRWYVAQRVLTLRGLRRWWMRPKREAA